MTDQEAQEKIARIIWSDDTGDEEGFETLNSKNIVFKITRSIWKVVESYIKQAGFVQLDENQSFPVFSSYISAAQGLEVQHDMFNSNFRRIKDKSKVARHA